MLIAISGQPGCRLDEVARLCAQRLEFELVTAARLAGLIEGEFGADAKIPDKAYPDALVSIVAQLATRHHLVFCSDGAESLFRDFPGLLRVHVVAPEPVRVGNVMLDRRVDRAAAAKLLARMESEQKAERKRRGGKARIEPHLYDAVLNSGTLGPDQMSALVEAAIRELGLSARGLLSSAAEARIQFQVRLRLSRHGIVPPGNAALRKADFAHASESIFANLLDFYRIAWEYEPRFFPLRWDADGSVAEGFRPDFYLPEFDVYIELTTMKQSHVTRKNRKVKLLRELYPQVNIQVFYQKDFENLIFKYGLAERLMTA
jgi:cytidylate kinase